MMRENDMTVDSSDDEGAQSVGSMLNSPLPVISLQGGKSTRVSGERRETDSGLWSRPAAVSPVRAKTVAADGSLQAEIRSLRTEMEMEGKTKSARVTDFASVRENELTCEAERQYREEKNTIQNFFGLLGITSSYLALVVILGLCFGAASTAFHKSIHSISHLWRDTVWEAIADHMPSWWFPCVHMGISTVLTGVFVGWVVTKYIPECEGGGTNAVKICLHLGARVPMHTGISRFILSTLYIGGGNPLGSEAPTLHICAVVASTVYEFVIRVFGEHRFSPHKTNAMVVVGCSCGLSAAFNTPMGGIIYALEEFGGSHGSSSSRLLSIWIALGSSAALAVHRIISGNEQFFPLDTVYDDGSVEPWMILSGFVPMICAGTAHVFMLLALAIREYRYNHISDTISMGLGSFIVSLIAALMYILSNAVGDATFTWGVYSSELTEMIENHDSWRAVFYVIGKFLICAVSAAFGGSGGLFTPAILLGGSLGVALSALFNPDAALVDSSSTSILAMMGMTGFFSALLRLPLTSAIVSYEMTSHLSTRSSAYLPVVYSSLLSYYFADLLSPYDLFQRMMLQDGVVDECSDSDARDESALGGWVRGTPSVGRLSTFSQHPLNTQSSIDDDDSATNVPVPRASAILGPNIRRPSVRANTAGSEASVRRKSRLIHYTGKISETGNGEKKT